MTIQLDDWHPEQVWVFGGLDHLCELWAKAIELIFMREVLAGDVKMAMAATQHTDLGVASAVQRWRHVPHNLRFVPPGIDRDKVTEADIRMWLKVGSILERAYGM